MAVLTAVALPAAWFASLAGQAKTETKVQTAEPSKVDPGNRPASPARLADEFVRALAERELTQQLDLQLSPDHWDIRGSLDPEEQQRFERLLVRFTETRKPDFPINVTLMSPTELLPFKVIEVVTGAGASVVIDSGDRLHVGDSYQGWRLSAVESGKVVFVGRQRVEVAL